MFRSIALTAVLTVISLGCSGESPTPAPAPGPVSGSNPAPSTPAVEPPTSATADPSDAPSNPVVETAAETAALDEAQKLVDAKDNEAARTKLTKIIAEYPRSARAYFLRGQVLVNENKSSEAITDFNKAIWEDPENFTALLERSTCYVLTGQEELALKDLDLVIARITPLMLGMREKRLLASAYMGKGNLYDSRREYESAIREYTKGIEVDPDVPTFWGLRGETYLKLHDGVKARADIDRALKLGPDVAAVIHSKVVLEDNEEFGNWDTFGEWVEKLLAATPEGSLSHYEGLLRRGVWRVAKKNYAEGIADLEKYLESDRNSATLNRIAWVLATCPDDTVRNGQKARDLAEEAWKLSEQKDSNCLDTLAAAHAELGDFAKAIETQEKALADADFAKSQGDKAQKRLEEYRKNQPHREP